MASLYERLNRIQQVYESSKPSGELPGLLQLDTVFSLTTSAPDLIQASTLSWLSLGSIDQDFDQGGLLFFDTETTGLSRGAGTLAFLIGFGRILGQELHIKQVMMRDYGQEAEALQHFLQAASGAKCLVSYNGKSFDLPLLDSRMTLTRMEHNLQSLPHLDLLHPAKRVYKLRLGRVPLTRLQEMILGQTRFKDIPGSEVPKRFFDYLKTRDEGLLQDVLIHNQQDILALANIFLGLLALHQDPLSSLHQEDIFSMGKVFEGQKQHQRAAACYRACSKKDVQAMATLRLAEMYRRTGQDEEAVALFEHLRQGEQRQAEIYISLAKIYEHRFRQPERALEIARQGMLYCQERFGFMAGYNQHFQDLEKRVLRLMRKAEKKQ